MLVNILSQNKRPAIVRPIPVKFGRNIYVYQVSLIKNARGGRYAVTKLPSYTYTGMARKTIGKERCGFGPEAGKYLCSVIIEFFGRHSRTGIIDHFPEGAGHRLTCLLHTF